MQTECVRLSVPLSPSQSWSPRSSLALNRSRSRSRSPGPSPSPSPSRSTSSLTHPSSRRGWRRPIWPSMRHRSRSRSAFQIPPSKQMFAVIDGRVGGRAAWRGRWGQRAGGEAQRRWCWRRRECGAGGVDRSAAGVGAALNLLLGGRPRGERRAVLCLLVQVVSTINNDSDYKSARQHALHAGRGLTPADHSRLRRPVRHSRPSPRLRPANRHA
eukprot:COSAG04_NODE_585_length_12348_cov_17.357907_13_plen_214_part_00